jgi:hypothetical protein
VFDPVHVNKKQVTIHVCIDFRDLNKDCPKDNYSTPFIDQIINECDGSEIFSFMDGFPSYNQIQICLEDQHKIVFIFPRVRFFSFFYKVKHEVLSILAFDLTITINVASTKITRRNTMHKNTKSIMGNPSQQGKKTQPKSFVIFFKRKTFTTNKT